MTYEYVKLTAKPNTYYDKNTEVFDYDGKRYTMEKWKQCLKDDMCGTRGLKNGKWDGEWSWCDEFNVSNYVKYKEII